MLLSWKEMYVALLTGIGFYVIGKLNPTFTCVYHFLTLHAAIVKDGAYYCYCAYVLRISRYSDFLSPMLTNKGIFLRGLKLSGESRSY